MSKRINAAKLKAMGLAQVRRTCERHALRALQYQEQNNQQMMQAHCALLDQCAVVGRELIHENQNRSVQGQEGRAPLAYETVRAHRG